MMKEHLPRERLRELELISLEERRLKGSHQYLMEQRRQTQILLVGVQWQAKRQKFLLKHNKNLFCCESDQRVAQIFRSVGRVSILRGIQNPIGQGPQQSALADSAWARDWTRQSSEVPANLSYSVILTFHGRKLYPGQNILQRCPHGHFGFISSQWWWDGSRCGSLFSSLIMVSWLLPPRDK